MTDLKVKNRCFGWIVISVSDVVWCCDTILSTEKLKINSILTETKNNNNKALYFVFSRKKKLNSLYNNQSEWLRQETNKLLLHVNVLHSTSICNLILLVCCTPRTVFKSVTFFSFGFWGPEVIVCSCYRDAGVVQDLSPSFLLFAFFVFFCLL